MEDQFDSIDSKITIRLIPEKRSITTYISGLEKFMNETEINTFKSTLKDKLGTRSVVRQLQENKKTFKMYGFGGDHREKVKEFLMKAGIDEEKITVKM